MLQQLEIRIDAGRFLSAGPIAGQGLDIEGLLVSSSTGARTQAASEWRLPDYIDVQAVAYAKKM